MYSEDDINSAVAAGALTPEAAESFRSHMSHVRNLPRGSEENVRLINSFNDIFVAIGVVILLLAAGTIGQAIAALALPVEPMVFSGDGPTDAQEDAYYAASSMQQALQMSLAGLMVAAISWPLAEFFTRKRRMALPSILLLLAFVGGVFASIFGLGILAVEAGSDRAGALAISVAGLVAAGAAYAHWKRFMVPITVAAGGAAVSATVIGMLAAILGDEIISATVLQALIFMAGLGVFVFAMRWDISDLSRTTRRSDVAFWLHLLAAPMIAHPIFALFGVTDGGTIGIGAAFGVIGVYIVFGLVALAIDRRALLVSALAYVLAALTFLFDEFGAVELNFALTALVIGSALLSLSAFWLPIRKAVVSALPDRARALVPLAEDPPAQVEPTVPA